MVLVALTIALLSEATATNSAFIGLKSEVNAGVVDTIANLLELPVADFTGDVALLSSGPTVGLIDDV